MRNAYTILAVIPIPPGIVNISTEQMPIGVDIHSGIESYWKGILSHDGQPGFIYDEVSRIGNELQKHSGSLSSLHKRNRIAMVVSPEALHALRHFPTDNDLKYNDIVDL